MTERGYTNEDLKKVLDLGMFVWSVLNGLVAHKIIAKSAVPKLIEAIPEIIQKATEIFSGGEVVSPPAPSQPKTIEDLLSSVGQIERDSAEMRFTTEQVEKLVQERGITDFKEILNYLAIGFQIASLLGLL